MKNFGLFVIVSLILFGCTSKEEKKDERVFPVTIAEAEEEDFPVVVEAIGNVYAMLSVQVRPQVGGIVEEAYVVEGGFVKQGDPLYKIDPRQYQYSLDQSKGQLVKDEASLKIAQVIEESYKPLLELDYVAKLNYEQYVANVEQAKGQVMIDKANIETAQLNLDWTTIISPIDGKISQYNIDPGNLVAANDTNALTTILTLDPADIRFNINQKDFVRVQEAMKEGNLTFEAYLPQDSKNPRKGEIYFVDNTLNLGSGMILLKGAIPNPDGYFWPGEFINVRLQLKMEPHSVIVPQEALRMGQHGSYVYIYNRADSTVELRKVVKGETVGLNTVIKEGVKAKEKVIVKGQLNLKNGIKVKVVEGKE